MNRDAIERFSQGKGVFLLWFGVLAGPAAWMLHLVVSYSLVLYVCRTGAVWLLHLTTGAMLLLTATAAWVAWRSWRQTGKSVTTKGPGVEGRSRFMALFGLAASVSFFLLILVEGVPSLVLPACG